MVDKRAVQQGYDELAEQYAGWRESNGRGMALLDDLLSALPADARLLDAGCGGGRPVLSRASDSTEAVGLDFSREQLRLADRTAPTTDRVQGDMTTLPFTTDTFDAVVAYWSLIHVPLAEHQTVLDEFARVLRPGGRLLVCEGTTEWVGENPDWFDSGTGMEWEIAGHEATERQLLSAGFAVTDRWGVAESVSDEESEDATTDEEEPWVFFGARLDE